MAKDVAKLAIDLVRNEVPANFSEKDANEVLRSAFVEIVGTDKPDYRTFRRHKVEIFEILEEALVVLLTEGIEEQFSEFAEIRNLAFGDTNVFDVEDPHLFKVAVISDGNSNLRRQRLDTGTFQVDTRVKGVKIYEEFLRFLAGRIDWVKMVGKVAKSYNVDLATEVYSAIYNSFNQLTAPFALNSAYTEGALIDLAQHVSASAGGADITVYGTKQALAKVVPSQISLNMIDGRNRLGYFGTVAGMELREIKQAHSAGTFSYAIDNNFLLVIPHAGDQRIVKIVNEGTAIIQEIANGSADQSMEYMFTMKNGVAVIPTIKYGIYRLA